LGREPGKKRSHRGPSPGRDRIEDGGRSGRPMRSHGRGLASELRDTGAKRSTSMLTPLRRGARLPILATVLALGAWAIPEHPAFAHGGGHGGGGHGGGHG